MTHSPPRAFGAASAVAAAPIARPYLLPQAARCNPPRTVRRIGAWLEAAFCAEARVMTPSGPRPAGALNVQDKVLTLEGGPQRIRAIWHHGITADQAKAWPETRPIHIVPNACGAGAPRRPLLVSPRAGLHVQNGLAQAQDVVGWQGITSTAPRATTYVQILLPQHALMAVDGMLCESLHPARLGTAPWDAMQLAEAADALPDIAHDFDLYGPSVRPRLRRAH